MRRYLDLIPISAKVHKKQSRMTKICIVLAVFLVTAIFGMTDMEIKGQKIQTIQSDGGWHAAFQIEDEEQADLIAARPEVLNTSWYGVLNYGLNLGYQIEGTETALCGFDKNFIDMFPVSRIVEGNYPANEKEVILTKSVKERLKLEIGDAVNLTKPDRTKEAFTISGFTGDTSMLTEQDAYGIFMNMDAFSMMDAGEETSRDRLFYVEFSPYCNIQKEISSIQKAFHLSKKQVPQNAKLLGLMGQSNDSYIMNLYGTAAILAVLVIVAGVLMITGSLNSNIAQRTEFFGMIRCLGASKKQVIRYVRLEAIHWCKTAIPIGIMMGVMVIWILCAVLKYLSPSYFFGMPAFAISWIGILCGAIVGITTVLFAAQAPAKRAGKVSPLTAVSGNADTIGDVKKAANTQFFKIDTALGIHHAKGSKKNLILMAGSFAFSIILFLAFTTGIDFMNHAIRPLRPYTPDFSIISQKNTCSISLQLQQKLEKNSAVQKVYGRMFAFDVPVQIEGKDSKITLISYERHQFDWAKDSLLEGSIENVMNGKEVLAVYHNQNPIKNGSILLADFGDRKQKLTISGILSDSPFSPKEDDVIIICSEDTFRRLTGENGYTIIDLQFHSNAANQEIAKIRSLAGNEVKFSDQRMKNSEAKGAYYSFALFVYGFLTVIALISVFNIINSIAMSVSARFSQYGVMRAIGIENKQLIKMITVETFTYTILGILVGCLIGLPIHKYLYEILVTSRWGESWNIPFQGFCVILIVIVASSLIAVYGPAKRLKNLTIVDTITAQ